MASACEKPNVIVSIDFGTTYSGYAPALNGTVFYESNLPRAGHREPDDDKEMERRGLILPAPVGKVPTLILVRKKDEEVVWFGEEAMQEYCKLDDDEIGDYLLFDRFKMVLLKNDDRDVSGDELIEASNCKVSWPAKKVFGKSLKFLSVKALECLKRAASTSLCKDEVQWVVTVPAIWGDKAKDFMRQAAVEAAMITVKNSDRLKFALEPEAAALSCRDALLPVWKACGHPDIMRYMVVDCGGGTVDITVTDLNMTTMKLSHVHKAVGNDWGGTKVDSKFLEVIRRVIGESSAKRIAKDDWFRFTRNQLEEAKQKVHLDGDLVIQIPPEFAQAIAACGANLERSVEGFPGVTYRKRRQTLILSSQIIRECFQESLDQITMLVQDLLQKITGVRCVMVAGGYAECPLLFDRLEREFDRMETASFDRKCGVIRPKNSSLAILKGAVMFAQDTDLIQERISRFTYGVRTHVLFNPEQHDPSKKVEADGEYYCTDIFNALVHVGDKLIVGQPTEPQTYFPLRKSQTVVSFELFVTDKYDLKYTTGLRRTAVVKAVPIARAGSGTTQESCIQLDFSQTEICAKAWSAVRKEPLKTWFDYE